MAKIMFYHGFADTATRPWEVARQEPMGTINPEWSDSETTQFDTGDLTNVEVDENGTLSCYFDKQHWYVILNPDDLALINNAITYHLKEMQAHYTKDFMLMGLKAHRPDLTPELIQEYCEGAEEQDGWEYWTSRPWTIQSLAADIELYRDSKSK